MARRRQAAAEPLENRLLAALPREDRDRLLARSELVVLAAHDPVYRANGPIDHAYFPCGSVISFVVQMESGEAVEVGTAGREGFAGSPLVLGIDSSPTRAFCQVPGPARRMHATAFVAEMKRDGPLAVLARRYTQTLLNLASQCVACNQLHPINPRCARWLLMTHDRVGADEFPLTQEFLAVMLGVRRASVTVAAGALQRAGIINYHRGRITILDRARLEEASCECYRVVRDEFERLLPPAEGSGR